MDNHVHLLVEDPCQNLSYAMHGLATAYALRYNGRTGHVGSVFQGRFASVPVESDRQLLQVVRYIHENPMRVGISATASYAWSSYNAYAGLPCDAYGTDPSPVLELMADFGGFAACSADDQFLGYTFRAGAHVLDEDALSVARTVLNGMDLATLKTLPSAQRQSHLQALRDSGLTVKQIERVTGIGRSSIARVTRTRGRV